MLKSTLRKTRIAGTAAALQLCMLLCPVALSAQSPVLQFTANYVSAWSAVNNYTALPASPGSFSGCSGTNYSYTWSNGVANQLKLTSFTANSRTYVVAGASGVQVKLRRVNNAVVTGTRNILYSESTAATATSCPTPTQLNFKAPYSDDMAAFLNNNVLNHGTDNVFTNASNGDGNNNNIERIDVIFTTGIASAFPADAGFVLCERGNNNSHDGFRIAAILSISGTNNPTAFGAAKTCIAGNGTNNGSWGHPSVAAGNKALAAYVLRKDAADTYLRVSSNVNQELGGVFFSLADLGVAADQIIYGYCLIGPDGIANPTSAQLLNTSSSTVYPTGTTEADGGGLDLISINTFYGTTQALAGSVNPLLTGTVQPATASLNWILNEPVTGEMVSLERSADGAVYTGIYSYSYFAGAGSNFRDNPGSGTFFYRLRVESASGSKRYSPVLRLIISQEREDIRIYPTFAKSGEPVIVENIPEGLYMASLQNMGSAVISRAVFQARNGKGTIVLPRQLSPGIYHVSVGKNGLWLPGTGKIIIQPR